MANRKQYCFTFSVLLIRLPPVECMYLITLCHIMKLRLQSPNHVKHYVNETQLASLTRPHPLPFVRTQCFDIRQITAFWYQADPCCSWEASSLQTPSRGPAASWAPLLNYENIIIIISVFCSQRPFGLCFDCKWSRVLDSVMFRYQPLPSHVDPHQPLFHKAEHLENQIWNLLVCQSKTLETAFLQVHAYSWDRWARLGWGAGTDVAAGGAEKSQDTILWDFKHVSSL